METNRTLSTEATNAIYALVEQSVAADGTITDRSSELDSDEARYYYEGNVIALSRRITGL